MNISTAWQQSPQLLFLVSIFLDTLYNSTDYKFIKKIFQIWNKNKFCILIESESQEEIQLCG